MSATANDILAALVQELPKALAKFFIHRKVEVSSRIWTNRLIALCCGHRRLGHFTPGRGIAPRTYPVSAPR